MKIYTYIVWDLLLCYVMLCFFLFFFLLIFCCCFASVFSFFFRRFQHCRIWKPEALCLWININIIRQKICKQHETKVGPTKRKKKRRTPRLFFTKIFIWVLGFFVFMDSVSLKGFNRIYWQRKTEQKITQTDNNKTKQINDVDDDDIFFPKQTKKQIK